MRKSGFEKGKAVVLAAFLALCMSVSGCGAGRENENKAEMSSGGAEEAGTAEESGTEDSWQNQYDLGLRYLTDGKYEEAIIAFTAAIEIDPKRSAAYVSLADAYESNGQTEEAKRVLSEAPEDVDDPEALKAKLEELGDSKTKEYPYLKEQLLYNVNGEQIGYYNYFYNEEGYMIRSEWARKAGEEEWLHEPTQEFVYEEAEKCWYTVYPDSPDIEKQIAWSGGERPRGGANAVSTCAAMQTPSMDQMVMLCGYPFPGGLSKQGDEAHPEVIYNDREGVYGSDEGMSNVILWHSAEYTYDESGRAARIDSYDADGNKIGWCICTYME